MTLQRARLTIDGDPDEDGTTETGVFEMAGNMTLAPGVRTGYLVGGQGSTANAVFGDLTGTQSNREGVYLDLGGGVSKVDINFWGWEGATDQNGNNYQWGNDDAQTKTQASATGQDPLTQICVFIKYLETASIDSFGAATLEYGEFASDSTDPDALYDPIPVAIEGPEVERAAEDGSWFTGRITCLRAAELNKIVDGQQRPE